jgi:ATP-binding cassette subfamily F protein 3
MNLLNCQNISISFSGKVILRDVSFYLEEMEKAALVGINGAGKTTLLRIVMGEVAAESGSVIVAKNRSVGYLPQNAALDSAHTVYEELLTAKEDVTELERRLRECEMAMRHAEGERLGELMEQYDRLTHEFEQRGGYAYQSEIVGVLKGLGFEEEEFGKQTATLSGGQKTRVALGKLLLVAPDLIILDEPTNHLDMNSISWLETYLMNYKGGVLIVSHDRYFLDRVAKKVIELEQGAATVFMGNYSAYAQKKEMLRSAAWHAYMNQQREIRHQEEVIEKLRRFNREKSIKRAESRVKMLDKMEVLDQPVQERTDMHLTLKPRKMSGVDVLLIQDLSKAFSAEALFAHVDLEIKRGEHVAIIGDNGTGKTTLLKMINGLLVPDGGCVTLGAKVEIGYYDQEHNVLHSDKTLFSEIADAYPTLTNTEIRNVLAAFLFTGDDVFQVIYSLSGGERGRVSLAKLMLSNANFLILDEPTNHLDIMSKEILENALNHYEGTVLYVSHDRYFINKTAHRILELKLGQFVNYLGNYDYYLEKREELAPKKEAETTQKVSLVKQEWQTQKEAAALKRKQENDLRRCEEEIGALEEKKEAITAEMNLPETGLDFQRLQELSRELEEVEQGLERLYERWDILAESAT